MKHHHHHHLTPALRELERLGISATVSSTGRNHLRVEWEVNGRRQSVIASHTPSCAGAFRGVLRDVRRRLRQASHSE